MVAKGKVVSFEILMRSAEQGDLEGIRQAIEGGLDPNQKDDRGWTPLLSAARQGQPEALGLLHELGADIAARMPNGVNMLHLAIEKAGERPRDFKVTLARDGKQVTLTDPDEIREAVDGHPDDEYLQCVQVVRYGLEQGVSPAVESQPQGQQALSSAAGWGCTEIVELLCSQEGLDLNHRGSRGGSALNYAARAGELGAVQTLIKAGAQVNIAENFGYTPLHEAAENGHREVAEALLSAGADQSAKLVKGYGKMREGFTPSDVARTAGHGELAERLAL